MEEHYKLVTQQRALQIGNTTKSITNW